MNLKNIFKSTILGTLLLSAGGCQDDIFDANGNWTGKIPDEFDVNIVVPYPQVVNIGSTRAENWTISTLNVLLLNEGGTIIENIEYPAGTFTYDADTRVGSLKIPLTQETKSIEVIANALTEMKAEEDPSKIVVEDNETMYLWGKHPIQSVIETGTVGLLRNTAMVTVELGEGVDNFEIQEVGVFGVADKGTVAPSSSATTYDAVNKVYSVTQPATPSEVTYVYSDDNIMQDWNPINGVMEIPGLFETPEKFENGEKDDDFVRVIIKGKYTDRNNASIDGYYVVALTQRGGEGDSDHPGDFTYGTDENKSNGKYFDILRNHKYIIKITEVRSEGWPQLSQAITAKPDNRMTEWVKDESPNITDIEASRDYYLGVGADVQAAYSENAVIEIATTYPGLTANADWKQKLDFEADKDWIQLEESNMTFEGNGTNVKVTIPLEMNTDSRTRYGQLKVRAGKLSREVNITQTGCPYHLRRKVDVKNMGDLDVLTNGYYSFLDGKIYNGEGIETGDTDFRILGLDKASNRDVDRYGLHFPVVPLYKGVKYYIEKKPGADKSAEITSGGSMFILDSESDSNNYIVTLAEDAEKEIKSGEGRLTITATLGGKDVKVEYKLFRTGIFHELKSDYSKYQAQGGAANAGWYYYEIVKVGNVYILDRNLGATSNLPYSPTSSLYNNPANKSAIGGYFMVNTDRWGDYNQGENKNRREDQQTITAQLGLHTPSDGKFVMATEEDYLNLLTESGPDKAIAWADASSSRVAEGKIYFPKGGYYEGSELKDVARCKLWTRTYLGGTQGMDVTSNEYGYWYRYYDDSKSKNSENQYSNIRIARGSNGSAASVGTSIYRYMPLRLVWVNNDCRNPEGGSFSGEDQVVRDKMVIYFEDSQNWSTVKYHVWDLIEGNTTWGWDNLPTAIKYATKDGSTFYRVEIAAPKKDSNAGILFKYGSDANNDQTTEYYLWNEYKAGNTVLWLKLNGHPSNNNRKWNLELKDSYNDESTIKAYLGNNQPVTTTYRYSLNGSIWTGSGWSEKFMTKSGSEYVLNDVEVKAGEFQINLYEKKGSATETKTVATFPTTHNLDTDVSYGNGSGYGVNWTLTAGTYTFTLNPTAKTLKVVKKTTPVVTYEITGSIWSDGGGWTKKSLTQSADNSNIWYLNDVVVKTGDFLIISNESSDNYYGGPDDSHKTIRANGTTKITVTNNSNKKDISITAGTYSFTFNSSTKELTVTGFNSGGSVTIPTGTYRIYWKKGLHDNIDRPKIEFWDGGSGNSTKDHTGEAGSYYYYDSNKATMHFHFLDSNGQNGYQQGNNWWQLNGDGDWEQIGSGGYSFYVDSYGDSCGKGLPSELK